MAVVINGNGTVTGVTAQDELNVDSNTLVVDSTNDRVGIGTSSPARNLHLNGSDSDTVQLHITNSTTGSTSNDGFSIALGSDESGILNMREANPIRFMTSDTERLRILSTGGITFNGDTATANALDDYEEGTFTVILRVNNSATGVTYATNDGCYTKIGRQVTCNGHLTLTSKGSNSGELKIDGLPFNVGNIQPNTSLESGGVFYYMTNASSNFTAMYPVAIHGSTELKIYYQNAADTSMTNNLQSSNIADNWDLRFSITYFT